MTPSKLNSLLQGQTSLARKVFEVVPIREAWPAIQIRNALKEVERSNADLRVVRGCLGALREAGLVREPETGMFQRADIRTPTPRPRKEAPMPQATPSPRPTLTVTAPAHQPEPSPIEILGELSGEVVALADEFGTRLKKLAAKIEEAALTIEQEREANVENLGKLRQLQSILKSLS